MKPLVEADFRVDKQQGAGCLILGLRAKGVEVRPCQICEGCSSKSQKSSLASYRIRDSHSLTFIVLPLSLTTVDVLKLNRTPDQFRKE